MDILTDIEVQITDGNLVLTDRTEKSVTFSKEQTIQRKVVMITLGELSEQPKKQIANLFGYATRKSYYDAREAVLTKSTEELLPKRTGPKKPTKRTRDLEKKVIQMRFDTTNNMYEIAAELQSQGFDVGSRLIGQILADYGLSKKNTKSGRTHTAPTCSRRV